MVELKRNEYEYHGRNLGLPKIINFSSNKLIGKLPSEISSLLDLISLKRIKKQLDWRNSSNDWSVVAA